jgi:hypothetical protein
MSCPDRSNQESEGDLHNAAAPWAVSRNTVSRAKLRAQTQFPSSLERWRRSSFHPNAQPLTPANPSRGKATTNYRVRIACHDANPGVHYPSSPAGLLRAGGQ